MSVVITDSNRVSYTGVASAMGYLGTGPSALKKYFLMYDQIALLRLGEAKEELRSFSAVKAKRADDFELCEEHGLVFETTIPDPALFPGTDIASDMKEAAQLIQTIRSTEARTADEADTQLKNIWTANSYLSRATACAMRKGGYSHAFVLSPPEIWTAPSPIGRRDQILRLVIEGFPEIDPEIPFQDVFQLRAEEEFLRRRDALRIWVRKTAEGKAEMPDIQEEFVYLLNEYRTYMNAIKVKYTLTSVGAVAKFSAGVLADIATLRWKDAVDSVFSLAVIPATLTEAEQKAPGRELSFLAYMGDRVGCT